MQCIHVRNLFALVVPVSCCDGLEAAPLIGTREFGFVLADKMALTCYQYHLNLLYEDDKAEHEKEAPDAFSWAKRNAIQLQRPSNGDAGAKVILKLKVNHGLFDFRKIAEVLSRIRIRCYDQSNQFVHEGSSALLRLLPKNRDGVSHGETSISIGWLQEIVAPQSPYIHSSPSGGGSSFDTPTEPLGASDQLQLYSDSADSPSFPMIPMSALFQPSLDQFEEMIDLIDRNQDYMVLYNGNAEVVGNFRAMNFYKASDINIKEDVRLLMEDHDARRSLLQIDGVHYKFKQGVNMDTNRRFVGYIAQQVESVVPEATQLIDGILHVDYESLIPYLSESIRANFKDIQTLNSKSAQISLVVDQLYDQFVKQNSTATNPQGLTRSQNNHKTRTRISTLLHVVIAAICVLGVVGGMTLIISMTQKSPINVPASPDGPSVPADSPVTRVPAPSYDSSKAYRILCDFFKAAGGSDWRNNTGWASKSPLCDWHGVECANDTLIGVRLEDNKLTGSLTSGILKLHFRIINLRNNSLTGTIPEDIGTVGYLKVIDLSHNRLNGTIPALLGVSHQLKRLDLSYNYLTGTISPALTGARALTHKDLSHNNLTGQIPDFLLTTSLLHVDLSHNAFTGSLPVLPHTMTLFNVENNFLSGYVSNIGTAKAVEQLNLSHNRFEGEFALSRQQHEHIKTLLINDNGFTSFNSIGTELWSSTLKCDAVNNKFACPLGGDIAKKCNYTCTAEH